VTKVTPFKRHDSRQSVPPGNLAGAFCPAPLVAPPRGPFAMSHLPPAPTGGSDALEAECAGTFAFEVNPTYESKTGVVFTVCCRRPRASPSREAQSCPHRPLRGLGRKEIRSIQAPGLDQFNRENPLASVERLYDISEAAAVNESEIRNICVGPHLDRLCIFPCNPALSPSIAARQ